MGWMIRDDKTRRMADQLIKISGRQHLVKNKGFQPSSGRIRLMQDEITNDAAGGLKCGARSTICIGRAEK